MGKPMRRGGGKRRKGSMGAIGFGAVLVALIYLAVTVYFKSKAPSGNSAPLTRESRTRRKLSKELKNKPMPRSETAEPAAFDLGHEKHATLEWASLPRDLDECKASQHKLMTIPVPWPGFHALCIESIDESSAVLHMHEISGQRGKSGTRLIHADASSHHGIRQPVMTALIERLKEELLEHEFTRVDPMVSTSEYDFPPNPWRLFTAVGGPVDADTDLKFLGRGAAVYLYTGGQFIWPGVRLGHQTQVPIPVTDGSPGGHKLVKMTTASLRPLVLVLSGFLTEAECAYVKKYASTRMVPSGLAMMDSSGSEVDVRTSTQTFMERGGSEQIRALEERAHNLTRLPYDLGENIQVVRYKVGQKYGAHRDFFNPNDYHRQPSMLRSVEHGARNRLATVFWYLETVADGGETFFPRALNHSGKEYKPWNGDHEDCYRGLAVQPVLGNAVLFYSMVPDGRLDERSLHGGCKPRGDAIEKWGANQWIWNHPQRTGMLSKTPPRRGAVKQPRAAPASGCVDASENCAAWARSGECSNNAAYMTENCKLSCGTC